MVNLKAWQLASKLVSERQCRKGNVFLARNMCFCEAKSVTMDLSTVSTGCYRREHTLQHWISAASKILPILPRTAHSLGRLFSCLCDFNNARCVDTRALRKSCALHLPYHSSSQTPVLIIVCAAAVIRVVCYKQRTAR